MQIPEPDELKAVLMLRGVATVLEKHHRVQLLDEAIEAAVKLSHRYIPARQLPDKAVSLLDTACARVAVSQHATPAEVEDCQRRIEGLEIESQIVAREAMVGVQIGERGNEVAAKLLAERDRLVGLEARWKDEKAIVDRILALRATLRGADKPVDGAPPLLESDRAPVLAELHAEQDKLAALQGDVPLMMPSVDAQSVASVVSDWTGIPVGRMVKNELESILRLGESLGQRVIGQQHGLDMIAKRIQTSRARLDNPNKPIGVFMLCGTSGVGKTETALALAEALYGGEQNVITINMSEFQEAHTVSTLKGSPPGYIGYGEGGILTEAVRRRPYSVVLLDEVEKAHSDVHELFFQVFDKGRMEDGEGRMIDFKNTIILLTSNAGSELIMNMCKDPELLPDPGLAGDRAAGAVDEDLPAGAARPPGHHPVLPAVGRDDEEDRAAAARPHQEARRGQSPHPVQLRRRRGRADRHALQQRRGRRSHHRLDPDQHRAAEGLGRVPDAHEPRSRAEGHHARLGGRRVHVQLRMTHRDRRIAPQSRQQRTD